jgi:hypothetical protein
VVTAQRGRVLSRSAGTPSGDPLFRHVAEQVGRQADRPDPLQLRDLGQEGLQAQLARVGRQLREEALALGLAVLVVADIAGCGDDAAKLGGHNAVTVADP